MGKCQSVVSKVHTKPISNPIAIANLKARFKSMPLTGSGVKEAKVVEDDEGGRKRRWPMAKNIER